jgi:predicted transglutaminase-like cysteine proteinase
MGQAKITKVHGEGKYDIEIVKHPGRSAKRLPAIAKRLAELTDLIAAALIAKDLALAALGMKMDALNDIINAGSDTKKALEEVLAARMDYFKKERAYARLITEKKSAETEQTTLTNAMKAEARTNVWCVDYTVALAVDTIVGTIEIEGDFGTILIMPGGATAGAFGLFEHVACSSPSGVFVNRAKFPAWQKWMPTYRTGQITVIDYATEKCSVGILNAYSREGAIPINQSGEKWEVIQAAVNGWAEFGERNPDFPLVTATGNQVIEMTNSLNDLLKSVQAEVNKNTYKLDTELYGKLEHWTIMAPGGSGDCEDFALTKAMKLLQAGIPANAMNIEVGVGANGQGHAWLVIKTDKGDIALDLNYADPMPNGALPYTGQKRQYGMEWKAEGVLLLDVPIEYMDKLNSAAFIEGDNVVVAFTDRDWKKPKVIGFVTDPRLPEALVYIGPSSQPFSEYSRALLQDATIHFYDTVPVSCLTALESKYIPLLILPCPVRGLTDAEQAAIAAFLAKDGKRVAVFSGTDATSSSKVLEKMGSKLRIMRFISPPSDYLSLPGVWCETEASEITNFTFPVQIGGFVVAAQSAWADAKLRDWHGFGLKYDTITALTYMTFLRQPEDSEPKWPSLFCVELRTALEAWLAESPRPYAWTLAWAMMQWNGIDYFSTGFVPGPVPYNADHLQLKNWLVANAGLMPFLKIAPYNTYPTPKYYQYGSYWDWLAPATKQNFEGNACGMAYENKKIFVSGYKPAFLDKTLVTSTGIPLTGLDTYTQAQEFCDWLASGDWVSRDMFGYGYRFSNFAAYIPLHGIGEGGGIPYVTPIQW